MASKTIHWDRNVGEILLNLIKGIVDQIFLSVETYNSGRGILDIKEGDVDGCYRDIFILPENKERKVARLSTS